MFKVVIDWGPAMRQQFDVRPEYEQVLDKCRVCFYNSALLVCNLEQLEDK